MPVPTLPNDMALQDLIVAQVGDLNSIVQTNITAIWALYGQYAANPLLRFLWVKRSCLELLAGAVWQQVATTVDGLHVDESQRHKAILAAMVEVDKQIALRQRASSASMVGQMVTTEIIPPLTTPQVLPSGPPDAGAVRYMGWPLSGRALLPN